MQGLLTPGPVAPSMRVLHLKHFEEASKLFVNWCGVFEQISNGRFQATLNILRGRCIRLIGIVANQRVLIRGHDTAGLVSVFPVTAGNAADLWQGRRLTPGQLVVNGVNTEVDHCSGRRTDDLGLSVHPQVLTAAARVLLNADPVPLSPDWNVISPPPETFATLLHQLARMLNMCVNDPSLCVTQSLAEIEEMCIRLLVPVLFASSTGVSPPPLPSRAQIVRRAEEFMRSHLREPVGAIELCRELGLSDRTLRLSFRERYGLGPMAYYKCLRLNAVRARLRQEPLLAIGTAASEFGFHHLGNFAADYRRLFGGVPSATRGQ